MCKYCVVVLKMSGKRDNPVRLGELEQGGELTRTPCAAPGQSWDHHPAHSRT